MVNYDATNMRSGKAVHKGRECLYFDTSIIGNGLHLECLHRCLMTTEHQVAWIKERPSELENG